VLFTTVKRFTVQAQGGAHFTVTGRILEFLSKKKISPFHFNFNFENKFLHLAALVEQFCGYHKMA
jgi:hypothetical protein